MAAAAYEKVPGPMLGERPPKRRDEVQPSVPAELAPYGLVALQQSAGNHAVTSLLARRPSVTPVSTGGLLLRQGEGEGDGATATGTPTAAAGTEGGAAPVAPVLGQAALRRSEQMRNNAAGRVAAITLFDAQASQAFRTFRPKRLQTSRNYRNAYRTHVDVLRQARSDAEFQNMIVGVVVGAVASVVVAYAAAVIVPTAAAASAFSAVGAASIGTQAVASSGLGTVAMSLISTSTEFEPVGSEDADELEAWRTMADLYERAREVSMLGARLGNHLGNTEYAIAQVQAHLGGGSTDMDWASTLDMVSSLMRIDDATAHLEQTVPRAREGFATLQERAATMRVPPEGDLEKNIWIVWMSALPNSRSDLLDRDAVEDRLHAIGVLGSGSILGVDFGSWTSEDDELEALAAARREAGRLRDEARAARS